MESDADGDEGEEGEEEEDQEEAEEEDDCGVSTGMHDDDGSGQEGGMASSIGEVAAGHDAPELRCCLCNLGEHDNDPGDANGTKKVMFATSSSRGYSDSFCDGCENFLRYQCGMRYRSGLASELRSAPGKADEILQKLS